MDDEICSDWGFIKEAVAQANPNALRLALYQQTNDPELASMRVDIGTSENPALFGVNLAPEDEEIVRQKAVEFLMSPAEKTLRKPTDKEAIELMGLLRGKPLPADQHAYELEELSFEDAPRDIKWGTKPADKDIKNFKVIVIGAGIGGIAAGVQLGKLGIPYQIIERHAGLGGCWFENDYPEARVDVSTFLYQYRFEKNYLFKHAYAPRDELQEYLHHVAAKYGVTDHITFQTEVTSGTWDEARGVWELRLNGAGDKEETVNANVVISASGLFAKPKLPNIDGLETFKGKLFHTTQWDHDYGLEGRKVAVIGTGSTACQLVRNVAEKVEHLTIFQRTPSWMSPVPSYREPMSAGFRWLLDTMPGYWHWHCYALFVGNQTLQDLQSLDPDWCANGGRVSKLNQTVAEMLEAYTRSQLPDHPELSEKCIPDYPPMARRIVVDNDYLASLRRPNVELNTDGIERFEETSIVTKKGDRLELDAVILGCGFEVSDYLWPAEYVGINGTTFADVWAKDGARAHLGMTVPGMPNFIIYYGPNGQPRSGSYHAFTEMWTRYACQMIVHMIENKLQQFDVKQESFAKSNANLDEKMKTVLWESEGKGGYYVNKHGRSGVNMSWKAHEYFNLIRRADITEYEWR